MKAPKIQYVCRECGNTSIRWLGRCPECQAWDSFDEVEVRDEPKKGLSRVTPVAHAEKFSELTLPTCVRTGTGMEELDRVLGGGLVDRSVVLLSGEPGIGKSTLLLQICSELSKTRRVLYVSGEESKGQLKLRADRLGIHGDEIYLLTETDTEAIVSECDTLKPDVIIIDSVQMLSSPTVTSAPGSVAQVREGAMT
ncbi:MAG TPA: DNA repair protein RadA, partial [Clostridiales bacterium]|nr:DNA repair protein RadA [Clostridiales bacterium]